MTEQGEQSKVTPESGPRGIGAALAHQRAGLATVDWRIIVLIGVIAGLAMPIVLTSGDIFQLLAGVVPVGAGLIIGRRVKSYYTLHGFLVGLIATVVGLITLYVVMYYTPLGPALIQRVSAQGQPPEAANLSFQFSQLSGFVAFALLIFCTFGASMSGRTEERNRAVRDEVAARGGQLERAPIVRDVSDIRGMSLPQFGSYVNGLWKKQGFTFKNYKFIDKDKHLDLWMERDGEPWHLRLSVADKVSNGTIESLYQEMKREGCKKGVVVTSTEFMPTAIKAAKDRPIVLVDGATLFEIAEK